MMTILEFKELIESGVEKPVELSKELDSLWWDRAGDWEKAHELVDGATDRDGNWVHAYLHRVEGDQWNAGYWYGQAGREKPDHLSLEEEWEALVTYFLAR